MKLIKLIFVASALLGLATKANAILITQADFTEELSLPFSVGPDARVLQSLSTLLGAGAELDESDEISNPEFFSGHADLDLSDSGLLTITGREPDGFADYQLAVFTLSNIMFDGAASVMGVNIIGLGNELFEGGSLFPTPDVEFTANSVTLTYSVSANEDFNFGEGQSAQFQLLFDDTVDVSAPSTLAILGLALFSLTLRRRQK